ncbi:CCCH zinc finger protein [Acrodontium crateriforme]|uniref:CCCH zinc finger protein n=1 Tax=Acrodontium crateriforme TaxID=150365 RepID=A0AAQ3LYQ3_9PEZI|nr:CCCH zinc finger protein [Acrodontium crateriforme]
MKNEEEELKAKIASITDKINQHKHRQSSTQALSHLPHSHPSSSWRNNHVWAPYHHGGRHSYPMHRNRTLVLNGQNQTSPPPTPPTTEPFVPSISGTNTPKDSSTVLVSMRGINKQLMNKDTYEREAKQKLERKEATRTARRQLKNREEQSKLVHHVNTASSPGNRILEVEGIRFQLQDDGSKLVRVAGEHISRDGTNTGITLNTLDSSTASKESPKRAMIAGVLFLRTKNGNLIRATVTKTTKRYSAILQSAVYNSGASAHFHRLSRREQCQHFTKNGNCPFGPNCRFAHDPSQVAICKDYLHGSCPRGDNCDLSHEATYHRVSACTHFLRGNCTNAACRYPHVHVSPAAPVCRPFATSGFCAKGPGCDKRHVIECPNYANTGHCADRENGNCQLPHPDRASTLRKAAQRQARMNASSENDSDVSSGDENEQLEKDTDDVDSDDVDEELIMIQSTPAHELTQQQDFVAFS